MTASSLPAPTPAFWRGRRVLVTGHTGFKGAWMTFWLSRLGAEVTGLALPPDDDRCLYTAARLDEACRSELVDLRDAAAVARVTSASAPQVVIHMAAQAIVRRSVADPLETFSSNVTGTANLLQSLRETPGLEAVVVVTSDKVYANDDRGAAFAEDAPLGGSDPYSASKAACEHVARSFARSYFDALGVRIVTARAGNVIGGGDTSVDRILPDCVRALAAGEPMLLRNPAAVRPWQHVLDCLAGYAAYAEAAADPGRAGLPPALNFGPAPGERVTVSELVRLFFDAYGANPGVREAPPGPTIEKMTLQLDPSLAAATLGWRCRLSQRRAAALTADWHRTLAEQACSPAEVRTLMARHIDAIVAPAQAAVAADARA